ncbi:hypothetical protein AALP_AA4G129200 [Arabis alpina]|uniref:Uncharacterized protein n=1 Tax=Arabis alpina TaxID=50452 RepID=A0A087H2X0_ARAAL|nr:hypothetical protein AALP_AA4G129200 [Arabis alpina]
MEKKVALVLALMLLVSGLVSAQEASPTIGQRIDAATTDAASFFNEHAGPAVDTVKSVFNWFGDKAKEWGL